MTGLFPINVTAVGQVLSNEPDDFFILSASWEPRCLGMASLLGAYKAQHVLLSVYDHVSPARERNVKQLLPMLTKAGKVTPISANQGNPLISVRDILNIIRLNYKNRPPRISIDISTFTKKHLLQLLHGLELNGFLSKCNMYYTESLDYHTKDDEPVAEGISSVKVIPTFGGENRPSRDTILLLFLGYEGRRALALSARTELSYIIAGAG